MINFGIRAFYRFSKYPETKPYRWQAMRAQALKDLAEVAVFIQGVPIVTVGAVCLIPHLIFEELNRRSFRLPADFLWDWASRRHHAAVRRLQPIYLRAAYPEDHKEQDPTKPRRPLRVNHR